MATTALSGLPPNMYTLSHTHTNTHTCGHHRTEWTPSKRTEPQPGSESACRQEACLLCRCAIEHIDRPTTDRINCVCSRVCVYACGYTKKGRGTCASGNWTQPNRGYVNMPLPSECSVPPGHKTSDTRIRETWSMSTWHECMHPRNWHACTT